MSTNFTSEDTTEANNRYNVWCEHVRSLFDQEYEQEQVRSNYSDDWWFEYVTNTSTGNSRNSHNRSNDEEKNCNCKSFVANGNTRFHKETLLTSSNVNHNVYSEGNAAIKNETCSNTSNMEKWERDEGKYPECFLLKMLPTRSKKIIECESISKHVCWCLTKQTRDNWRQLTERNIYCNNNNDDTNNNNKQTINNAYDEDDCDIHSELLCQKLQEEMNRLRTTTAQRDNARSSDLQKTFALTFCDPTVEAIEAQLMEELTELLLIIRRENAAAAELRRQLDRCSIVEKITRFAM